MAEELSNQPIIIKRRKKGHHDAHHGGAWKVAYADFVTAMMAFFLLLWLLNVTTDEQKTGIANYFAPASQVPTMSAGTDGVLSGKSVTMPGVMIHDAPMILHVPIEGPPGFADEDESAEDSSLADPTGSVDEAVDGELTENAERPRETRAGELDDAALEEELARREQAQFEAAEQELRQAIQSVPELAPLIENILIDQTPEGMRIQIVDQEKFSMFPLGSARLYPQAQQLLGLVAKAVGTLPNRLSISGHTDSTPFANADVYDNWELSTDRANASRRALTAAGIDGSRILTVVGRADRDHLVPEDPNSPTNRRISIVLLREAAARTATAAAAPAPAPASVPAPAPAAPERVAPLNPN